MKNNNFIRNLALFAAIAGIAGVSAASAAGPWGNQAEGEKPNFDADRQAQMQEHKAQMQEVIESGDYGAFVELVGDRPYFESITEDNFAQFIQMHELMQAGDREGAKAIAEELGLPGKPGKDKISHGRMIKFIKDGGLKDVNGDGMCDFAENKPDLEASLGQESES